MRRLFMLIWVILMPFSLHAEPDVLPGFIRSQWFKEQTRLETTATGVRVYHNIPGSFSIKRSTLVVFYATPNGNTIEQTLGCRMTPGLDWHYDIQHIAAQTRKLRETDKDRNIVLVVMQPENKSWPAWRSKIPNSDAIIRQLLENTLTSIPGEVETAVVTGHSGGGSMIFGFINACDVIPGWVERIAFLDANYGYSDDSKHGNKLLDWLKSDANHRLVVIAYDDRNITLDGKPVVTTGGTFRASHRMLNRFEENHEFVHTTMDYIDRYEGSDVNISFFLHRNPKNKILHTTLIGEMNGYLKALTTGTALESACGQFGGPRAYRKWIQPKPD